MYRILTKKKPALRLALFFYTFCYQNDAINLKIHMLNRQFTQLRHQSRLFLSLA